MKRLKIISPIFILGLILVSCSDWEQEIVLPNTNVGASKRIVVIEEFTGASCVNCPAGIAQSTAIADLYPDNIVFIAVHSKFLAQPATKGQPDLRAADAQAVEDFLGFWLAKPEAAINRYYESQIPGFRIGNPDSWKSYVDAELKKDPLFDLGISVSFDDNSRELSVMLTAKALQDITKPVHIHCGIVESGIIADQLDNVLGKIVDYEHNHVLREMLSPISGDRLANSVTAGMQFNKQYTFTMPVDTVLWNADHCDVIAYVSFDENEKYILQAAEAPVK